MSIANSKIFVPAGKGSSSSTTSPFDTDLSNFKTLFWTIEEHPLQASIVLDIDSLEYSNSKGSTLCQVSSTGDQSHPYYCEHTFLGCQVEAGGGFVFLCVIMNIKLQNAYSVDAESFGKL